ncbi:MAG: peptidoglycan DD-metalloendopeptidase family protein [Alphaproteobacteria bacterium]|nr:peptidoglycan DD-metalloendopeptidase family protein [Alphaproteobacteria bacterium]MBV8548671.1 peptidoglycan DD-metalloendopeptidase family protein [Alphaproteobacteria bacterium]
MRFSFLGPLFVVTLLAPATLWASPNDTKTRIHTVENQIEKRKADAAVLDEANRETVDNLVDLRQKLITATEALEEKQAEEQRLQDKQDELTDAIDTKSKALVDERHKLQHLLTAMIEMARQPPESFVLRSGLTNDYIHRTIVLHNLVPKVREQAEALARDIATLNTLKKQLDEQKRLVTAAEENLEEQRQSLDQLIKSRQGLLQRSQTQRAEISKQLVSLAAEAHDLHQLLEKITPKRAPKNKAPETGDIALKWPAGGRITHSYGEKDEDGVKSEGVTLASLPGAPIVAPAAGKVVFLGPFKGYGQVVILQHADGYHSFMAGFGRIDADLGQDVDAGEPLGVLPVKGQSKPELYFEWRHHNDPVDPATRITLQKSQ